MALEAEALIPPVVLFLAVKKSAGALSSLMYRAPVTPHPCVWYNGLEKGGTVMKLWKLLVLIFFAWFLFGNGWAMILGLIAVFLGGA